jgi:hypothetical protein
MAVLSTLLRKMLDEKKKEIAELTKAAEEHERCLREAKRQSSELFGETLILSEVLEELEGQGP